MRVATILFGAAALVASTATGFAQVTPGGPGDRHSNEIPSATTPPPAAGMAPSTRPDYETPRGVRRGVTTGQSPGQAGSGQEGARRANEAPMAPR